MSENNENPDVRETRSVEDIDKDIHVFFVRRKKALAALQDTVERDGVMYRESTARVARIHVTLLALVDERIHTLQHATVATPTSSTGSTLRGLKVIDNGIPDIYDSFKSTKADLRKKSEGSVEHQFLEKEVSILLSRLRGLLKERIQVQEALEEQENERFRAQEQERLRAAQQATAFGGFHNAAPTHAAPHATGGVSTPFSFGSPQGVFFGGTTPANTPAPASASFGHQAPVPFGHQAPQTGFDSSQWTAAHAGQSAGLPFGSPPLATAHGGMFSGASSAALPFGQPAVVQEVTPGTSGAAFQPMAADDGVLQSITAMPQYNATSKSFEELRWEDYMQGNRGSQLGRQATSSGFAQASSNAGAPLLFTSGPSPILAQILEATTPAGAAAASLPDALRFRGTSSQPTTPSSVRFSFGRSLGAGNHGNDYSLSQQQTPEGAVRDEVDTPRSDQAVGSVASTLTRFSLSPSGGSSERTPTSSNRGTRRTRSARK